MPEKTELQNEHLEEENQALGREIRRLKRENEVAAAAAGGCMLFAAFVAGLLFGYIIGDW